MINLEARRAKGGRMKKIILTLGMTAIGSRALAIDFSPVNETLKEFIADPRPLRNSRGEICKVTVYPMSADQPPTVRIERYMRERHDYFWSTSRTFSPRTNDCQLEQKLDSDYRYSLTCKSLDCETQGCVDTLERLEVGPDMVEDCAHVLL